MLDAARPRAIESGGIPSHVLGKPPMSDSSRFLVLLTRLRAGDDRSASDLFAEYEPAIRRMIRTRLRNLSLQRLADEEDVCQSVMRSFFLRYRLGQYELGSPEQLRGLLARMAGNKLNDQHRRHLAARRDIGRVAGEPPRDAAADAETPSVRLGNQELLEEAVRRMTPEEREIRELFLGRGLSWAEIAAQLGGTAEGRRKQWERVRDRVTLELGLEACRRGRSAAHRHGRVRRPDRLPDLADRLVLVGAGRRVGQDHRRERLGGLPYLDQLERVGRFHRMDVEDLVQVVRHTISGSNGGTGGGAGAPWRPALSDCRAGHGNRVPVATALPPAPAVARPLSAAARRIPAGRAVNYPRRRSPRGGWPPPPPTIPLS